MKASFAVWAALFALILWAPSAVAAGPEGSWPTHLFDDACDDSFDTPAQFTPPPRSSSLKSARVQTSGSGDGYCDADSAILTGAIVADTSFTLDAPPGARNLIVFLNLTENLDDGTWRVCIRPRNPTTAAFDTNTNCSANETGNLSGWFAIGPTAGGFSANPTSDFAPGGGARTLLEPFPAGQFVLYLDLITADSITGTMGVVWVGE